MFSIPLFLLFAGLLACGICALIVLTGSFDFAKSIMPVKSAFYPAAIIAVLGGCLGIYFLRQKKPLQYLFNFLGIIFVCAYFFTVENVVAGNERDEARAGALQKNAGYGRPA